MTLPVLAGPWAAILVLVFLLGGLLVRLTTPILFASLGDAMAATLDPATLAVRLWTDGPSTPGPDDVLGNYTLAVGSNSKTITAWEERLDRLGKPTLTSTNILEFVPGTDIDVGQTIRGFVIVNAGPDLVGAERFPNSIEATTSDDHVKFVINIALDPDGNEGVGAVIE